MGHFSSVIHNRIIQDIEILLINTNIYDGSWVNKGELFINTLVKKNRLQPNLNPQCCYLSTHSALVLVKPNEFLDG
jgi:hypothetical protein